MIFLSVVKNESGDWVILKVITNPINVRGNKTGNTYGDISKLDLDTRRDEGFWTQNDVYVNTGEYMVFDNKVTTFDEQAVEVTNTYNYVLMPLEDIRTDLKSRVNSKRDQLYFGGFDFNGHTFGSGNTTRSNVVLFMTVFQEDAANFPSDFSFPDVNGDLVDMDLATFKQFIKALSDFTRGLYSKARSIRAAIDAATTYDDIRAAASWDDEPL
ncbi:hypothetical protein DQT32_05330 [Salmonella enterica subsp. enterica serovar Braenderup]|nr:hypothetical protein [Salmonella enterica subsp. enterica serovar Braenderup]